MMKIYISGIVSISWKYFIRLLQN